MLHVATAARAIIQRDGKLLVIRYRDEHGDFYAMPGGEQRHGESLAEAVIREVAEETGAIVLAGKLRFVRECRGSPESRSLPVDWHSVELFFDCELIRQDGQPTLLDPGQADSLWLTPNELRQRCFFPMAILDSLDRHDPLIYLGMA